MNYTGVILDDLLDSAEGPARVLTVASSAPLGSLTRDWAGCPSHGAYLANEWCEGCEQAEERRLNAEWGRTHGVYDRAGMHGGAA